MHMLHLLRHAKSSWKDDVEDHERPLNKRGREAARLIGAHLRRRRRSHRSGVVLERGAQPPNPRIGAR